MIRARILHDTYEALAWSGPNYLPSLISYLLFFREAKPNRTLCDNGHFTIYIFGFQHSSHLSQLNLINIKQNVEVSSSVILDTFKVLNNQMRPVATVRDMQIHNISIKVWGSLGQYWSA